MLLLALAGMFLLAFLPTYAFLPALIRALRKHKHLLRADMNKPNKPLVPSFGGIALVTGFLFALIFAILVDRFMGLNGLNLGLLLPALLSTALCALLGLVDDLLGIPRRVMVPYFLHFLLYSRNGYAWKPNMWGVPLKNGRLRARYSKAYGLMQWVLARGPQTEKQVVNQVFAFETVFALAAVALEWAGKG